ncbi:MAG TPA: hypothetical protein VIM63_11525 [Rhodoferax sp.]
MNKLILSFGALLCAASLHTTASAADVGVSVNIAQPGFYGRIDIGRVPQPAVIYAQPLIIEQRPMTVMREPIYLRVPPGHEKHWDRYCRNYGACGQPVYFVQDRWYRDVYAPRYYGETDRRDDGRYDRRDGRHDNGRHGHGRKDDRGGD